MNIEQIQQQYQTIKTNIKQYEQNLYDTYKATLDKYNTFHQEQKQHISQLPNYWLYVIQNSDWSKEIPISEIDYFVLKNLEDISITQINKKEVPHSILQNETTIIMEVTIQLTFKPNKFMEKLVLEKTFSFNVNENNYPIIDVKNSGIEMTDTFYNQLGENDSFFNFFAVDDDDEVDDEGNESRKRFDINVCKIIIFDILPFSFEYFKIVNEVDSEEEDDFDDEYDDGKYDDEDDEGDEDYDDDY